MCLCEDSTVVESCERQDLVFACCSHKSPRLLTIRGQQTRCLRYWHPCPCQEAIESIPVLCYVLPPSPLLSVTVRHRHRGQSTGREKGCTPPLANGGQPIQGNQTARQTTSSHRLGVYHHRQVHHRPSRLRLVHPSKWVSTPPLHLIAWDLDSHRLDFKLTILITCGVMTGSPPANFPTIQHDLDQEATLLT